MHLFNRPPKAPHQLELHKAALIRHQQGLVSPPTQQVRQASIRLPEHLPGPQKHLATDPPLSMGNVFQDGITQLPVTHLTGNHLLRVQESRAQRLQDRQADENGRGEEKKPSEHHHLLPTIRNMAHKTSNLFSHARKILRKYLDKLLAHIPPRKSSGKTVERRPCEVIVKNAEAKSVETQLFQPIYPSEKELEAGFGIESRESIEMVAELDATFLLVTPLVTGTHPPDWPLRAPRESFCWI
ncbi:hypothetical protein DSL72_005381 [Monilinia vaccinii-corymbosi]|uniref:Uncharacterized protein n=1 Tax=Monilinia vaccinii-corymbosi TaxID=61207 RepID=A0A8A3PFH3_9HELO|nr:hypothetical protein DSL72_005381 [Monilinia vaccinii-corymbosi]